MIECPTCGFPRWRGSHDYRIHWVAEHWTTAVKLESRRNRRVYLTGRDLRALEDLHVELFHDEAGGTEVCIEWGVDCRLIGRPVLV